MFRDHAGIAPARRKHALDRVTKQRLCGGQEGPMLLLLTGAALAASPFHPIEDVSGTLPMGLEIAWGTDGCQLYGRFSNAGAAPLEIDWMRSTISENGGPAVATVPGSTSKVASMQTYPPLVVPPGSWAEEIVYRKDRLPSDGDFCIAREGVVMVTLNVAGDWAQQRLVLPSPQATLAPEPVDRCTDLRASIRRRTVLTWTIGAPVASVSALMAGSGVAWLAQGDRDAAVGGLATGSIGLLAAAAFIVPVQLPIKKWKAEIATACAG